MALASRPELIIADEPTTALDSTIQLQIMDLIEEIKNHNNNIPVIGTMHSQYRQDIYRATHSNKISDQLFSRFLKYFYFNSKEDSL